MIVARRYLVSGHVQGVGFRFFVRDVAHREGLQGHVRNLVDGRVEAMAVGEVEAMSRFERALAQGPPHAEVEDVSSEDLPPDVSLTEFEISG